MADLFPKLSRSPKTRIQANLDGTNMVITTRFMHRISLWCTCMRLNAAPAWVKMGPFFPEILTMKPTKDNPAFDWWCNLLYGTIQYKDNPAFDWWCNLLYGTIQYKDPAFDWWCNLLYGTIQYKDIPAFDWWCNLLYGTIQYKDNPAFDWWCNLLYGTITTIQYKDIPAFDWWCNLLCGTTAEPHFKNPLNNQA